MQPIVSVSTQGACRGLAVEPACTPTCIHTFQTHKIQLNCWCIEQNKICTYHFIFSRYFWVNKYNKTFSLIDFKSWINSILSCPFVFPSIRWLSPNKVMLNLSHICCGDSTLCTYSWQCPCVVHYVCPLSVWLCVPSVFTANSATVYPCLNGCLCPLYVQLTVSDCVCLTLWAHCLSGCLCPLCPASPPPGWLPVPYICTVPCLSGWLWSLYPLYVSQFVVAVCKLHTRQPTSQSRSVVCAVQKTETLTPIRPRGWVWKGSRSH